MTDAIIQALQLQGAACERLSSPFNGALCAHATAALAESDDLEGLFAPWAQADVRELFNDAVVLRLLGALHDLVLSGDDLALAAAYPRPERPADSALAWREARRALAEHRRRIVGFMSHEPQTNEVRRAICLVGGFLTVAAETGLPLRTFELGASAGLNLFWDRFHYDFVGGAAWGDPASPVQLDSDWQGSPPPTDAAVRVIERAACDRRPVRLDDPAQRRRLLAYLWPDQFERIARIRAAIDLAAASGVTVEEADAPVWAALHAAPQPGAATVLYHSVFWQYVPAQGQAALRAAVESHAAAATPGAPFAWLRMEPPPDNMAGMEVRLTLWPGGEDRLLAHVHPHGATVRWVADQLGSAGQSLP